MDITEAYAESVAHMLKETGDYSHDALMRVVRILDPQTQHAGTNMPYPPDKGWQTALEQQLMLAQTANDTVAVILGRLREALGSGQPGNT